MAKIIVYQVLPRLFGNRNTSRIENGTIAENGCGKMNTFDLSTLTKLRTRGMTHIWYTGLIRHATQTDYSSYGIPTCHPAIVKGKAGSPYAITDYYDVDPDLAVNVEHRMQEFQALVERTHKAGLKMIIDFVPNHVARQYHSIMKPEGVEDLGANDDMSRAFDPQNNFYYCPGQAFAPCLDLKGGAEEAYEEIPAKATGNDRFDPSPGTCDWYETVKLNYGVDYCGGHTCHFSPMPDTWTKMTDILLYWASKGVDGFRCDMAEMVPVDFWHYAIAKVKEAHPEIIFIAEVYNPAEYRNYVYHGLFDYLYDKVGMYDTMRAIICGQRPASAITEAWQATDDINGHMLYFLENHDEQRIASDFFAGDGRRALPGVMASAWMRPNPFMVYAGQCLGERGMDKEGFSGCDGRTTIFDYWSPDTLCRLKSPRSAELTAEEKRLRQIYHRILLTANSEKALAEGDFFDLMYVNPSSWCFNPDKQYAFLRKKDDELLLVVVNFSDSDVTVGVCIPSHAFSFFNMAEEETIKTRNLWDNSTAELALKSDVPVKVSVGAYSGSIYKFNVKQQQVMNEVDYELNDHNKEEFPPAHTAEHLLNQLMIRMFDCERSRNAHIERKKSKISYVLTRKPDRKEEKEIERRMNELIAEDLPVTYEFVKRDEIPEGISLDKLPDDASETIRLVRIGDYDVCPCIGRHVRSTGQIGRFEMLGTNWDEPSRTFRIRFKIV